MELVRIPFYCLYSAYAIAANRVCNAIAGACQARLYAQIMRASVKVGKGKLQNTDLACLTRYSQAALAAGWS